MGRALVGLFIMMALIYLGFDAQATLSSRLCCFDFCDHAEERWGVEFV